MSEWVSVCVRAYVCVRVSASERVVEGGVVYVCLCLHECLHVRTQISQSDICNIPLVHCLFPLCAVGGSREIFLSCVVARPLHAVSATST